MKEWNLKLIINRFDQIGKSVDFQHLPEKNSPDYRKLVLDTANQVLFSRGRYHVLTEMTLEIFQKEGTEALLHNLTEIHGLTDSERIRLPFYTDLIAVCYPLFSGKKVDWTAWPWNLESGSSLLDNEPLYEWITECRWPGLSAAIIYNLKEQEWAQDRFYTSVARNCASNAYDRHLEGLWKKGFDTEEKRRELCAAICYCADELWSIDNHLLVGQMLGLDLLSQSIYDAMDTFIDTQYRANQVTMAKELARWIRKHRLVGRSHPGTKTLRTLRDQMECLMEKYHVQSPDAVYSWNILAFDVLGYPAFEPREYEDDDWDDLDSGENVDLTSEGHGE